MINWISVAGWTALFLGVYVFIRVVFYLFERAVKK